MMRGIGPQHTKQTISEPDFLCCYSVDRRVRRLIIIPTVSPLPLMEKNLVVAGILSIAPVIRADDACRHRVGLDTTNRLDYVNRHDRRYVYL
jgi:hypothetical protein